MGLTELLLLFRGWTWKFYWLAAMADSEKWLLSQIGVSIEKMCLVKNASFFLNLGKRKLHVEISPDLYDFCEHLKLSY